MSSGAEVAVSQNDFVALRRRYWPVRAKFRQIYHSRIREGEALQGRPRTKTILCAGTVGARKGQPYLCEAFAQLASEFSDWNLLLIGRPGDDQTVDEVQRAMNRPEVHGRITWIRDCSDMQLREWFQSVEIFAMPSLHEGLGLTLQEALYYGCACIASRIGGIPDLIRHEANGILVTRADAVELARGLRRLMTDGALRQRLHERGRQSVLAKNMTSERMIAQYEQLYRALEGTTPATVW
jgi:glycosyltransferase involved in cell wall biosynthesis